MASFYFSMAMKTVLLFAIAMKCIDSVMKLNPVGARLKSGKQLGIGESLSYGDYSFSIQLNCNLVLYNDIMMYATWASKTSGKGSNCILKLHHDGNLVIYNNNSKAVWATNTNHKTWGTYTLILQEDHNVVLYDQSMNPIWATGTSHL